MSTSINKVRRSTLKAYEAKQGASWQLPLLVILFVSVVFVAIKTVVHRHHSRSMFMELQALEKQRDKLVAQWSRLKLEQGTLLNQVRVERQARRNLGMQMPKTTEIKIVRETLKMKVKHTAGNRFASGVSLSD